MQLEVKEIIYVYVRGSGWVATAVRAPKPPTITLKFPGTYTAPWDDTIWTLDYRYR